MGERTVATEELKTKFFFADALDDSERSVADAVNKWLRQTRNIQVYDILHKHRNTVSRNEGVSYIGVVYCARREPRKIESKPIQLRFTCLVD